MEVDVSALRVFGILAGAALILIGMLALRRAQPSAPFFSTIVFGGAGVALVSIFPQLATVLNDVLSIGAYPGSRLIALLLVAILVLWVLFSFQEARLVRTKEQVDRLIRYSAVKELSQSTEVAGKIPSGAIMAVIPAFNEADNIGGVLKAFPKELFGAPVTPLIIDDGSTDGTREVAEAHGAVVLRSPFQRGGGAAIRLGFDAAEKFGARIAVNLDADGQNDPAEMAGLIEPIIKGEADVVIGSRILGSHEITHWWRHVGVKLFSALFNSLMGARITDISSGYRAIRVDKLAGLRLMQDQYHTSEFLMMCAKQGYRIKEAPIHFRRRTSGTSKKGNELLYGFRFARALLTTWLRAG